MSNVKWLAVTLLCVAVSMVFALACDIEETAEDAAKDQVDTSFDKDVEFELEPLVAEGGGTTAKDMDCGTTSVKAELEKNDVKEDEVDIDSIDLRFVSGRYSEATWMPEEVTHMACVMTLTGNGATVTIADYDVERGDSEWTEVEVSDDAVQFINYFLNNRNEEFDYCVECSDADSYSVTWEVSIGVTVHGEIK